MRRKSYSADFKSRVTVEAIRGVKPISQIASHLEAHPTQVSPWKKQALDDMKEKVHRGKAKSNMRGLRTSFTGRSGA